MKSKHFLLCLGIVTAMMIGASSSAMAVRPVMGGTIGAIDDFARTFTCTWNRTKWVYKTTDATTYWIGRTKASWYDLKVGSAVKIGFHRIHGERVANAVRIQAHK